MRDLRLWRLGRRSRRTWRRRFETAGRCPDRRRRWTVGGGEGRDRRERVELADQRGRLQPGPCSITISDDSPNFCHENKMEISKR